MKNDLVVISWWSNALGLACVHHLQRRVADRQIHVVQVGKSEQQKSLFRMRLPSGVREILYPVGEPAEHFRVLDYLVRNTFHTSDGVWFVDHDFIVTEDLEPFLETMETAFGANGTSLCHTQSDYAITCPFFWVSPVSLPENRPAFDPIPPMAISSVSQRPDIFRAKPDLINPQKDTLVCLSEFLAEQNRVAHFTLDALPEHDHLGGLSIFSAELLSSSFDGYVRDRVKAFQSFFDACPPEWLGIEDPVLLARINEFGRRCGL